MSEVASFDPATLRVQTNVSKSQGERKVEDEEDDERMNGNLPSSSTQPFAGEMERRGEEKVRSWRGLVGEVEAGRPEVDCSTV